MPYAHGDGDWVGYDNIDSIHYKVDMAKSYGFGGIMWWAIDIDDFRGEYCGQGMVLNRFSVFDFCHKSYEK